MDQPVEIKRATLALWLMMGCDLVLGFAAFIVLRQPHPHAAAWIPTFALIGLALISLIVYSLSRGYGWLRWVLAIGFSRYGSSSR